MNTMELIWVGAAYLSGLIASRLFLPPLVGYLVAGYVLHGFGVVPLHSLSHLAEIGIELLLFLVGLKLKPKSLLRREVLSVGGLHLLIMTLVSAIVFVWLDKRVTGGLVLGLSLAFSSTVLAIKVLEDNGELSSLHGRDVISILILQDIIAIALLAFAEGKQPTPWAILLFLLPLLRPIAHRVLSVTRAPELKLLLGVSLAIAGGVLAESVGVGADVGALLTGMMLADHPNTDEMPERLWGLKEFFLVAFFLQIGLTELPGQQQIYQALMLLGLLPVQGAMFFGLFILAGMRARTAFVAALALMTYSEFALITTSAVVDAHLLPEEWQSIISLAVAGSLAIAAPLNRFSAKLFIWLEPILSRCEKKSVLSDQLPSSFGDAAWLIVGMGRTGQAAYQSLCAQQQAVVGLDADPTVLDSLLANGMNVSYADVSDAELWNSLSLNKVRGVILTLPSFDHRINAVSQLRKLGFPGIIGTICYLVDDESQLKGRGANFVIHPLVEAGNQLATQMLVYRDLEWVKPII